MKQHRRQADIRIVLFSIFCLLIAVHCHAAPWKVKDAPYRATLRLIAPPNDTAAGVEIELPDFGASRDDLGDALSLIHI